MTPAAKVADALAVKRVQWREACRIVPARHPSIYLYDRVADAADFDALYALEALTNDRVRDETGVVQLVAPEDRVFGAGSGPIMAALTHVNPSGSRFSDGGYGMFYAARERATAVAETAYHHARFLAATREGAMHLPMHLYQVAIDARLHDLRAANMVPRAVFDPDDYGASRALGRVLHGRGSAGVVYRSVRRSTGHCVGLFKPRGAKACLQAAVLLYAWNGERFTDVYEKVEA